MSNKGLEIYVGQTPLLSSSRRSSDHFEEKINDWFAQTRPCSPLLDQQQSPAYSSSSLSSPLPPLSPTETSPYTLQKTMRNGGKGNNVHPRNAFLDGAQAREYDIGHPPFFHAVHFDPHSYPPAFADPRSGGQATQIVGHSTTVHSGQDAIHYHLESSRHSAQNQLLSSTLPYAQSSVASSPPTSSPPVFAWSTPSMHSAEGFDPLQTQFAANLTVPEPTYQSASSSSTTRSDADSITAHEETFAGVRRLNTATSGTSDASATTTALSMTHKGHKKSHARKRTEGHIKRPPNAFILFRSHAYTNNLIPKDMDVHDHRDVSRIIAHMWNNLPTDERQQWMAEAQKEKLLHKQRFPDYQFKPESAASRKKSKRNLKRPDNVEVKCEAIADSILRSYGRDGVQIKPKESSKSQTLEMNVDAGNGKGRGRGRPKSKAKRADEEESGTMDKDAKSTYEPVQSTSTPQSSKRTATGTPYESMLAKQTRGKGKGKAKVGSDEAEVKHTNVNQHQEQYRPIAPPPPPMPRRSISLQVLPSSAEYEPFETVMRLLSSSEAGKTTDGAAMPTHVGTEADEVSLFMDWSRKLNESAGYAAANNLFSQHGLVPDVGILARTVSDSDVVAQQNASLKSAVNQESASRYKKRPERLALASSTAEALPLISPRGFLSTISPPPTSATRLWQSNMDGGSAFSEHGASLHAHTLGRPKTSSDALRHRGDWNFEGDAMLVSPMYATFADLRKYSAAASNGQVIGPSTQSRSRAGNQSVDGMVSSLPSRLSFSSNGPLTSAGFPITPGTAHFDFYHHSLQQSRRNSLALDMSGMGPLNLSPRASVMDIDTQSIVDSILARPPATPSSAIHSRQEIHGNALHRRQSSLLSPFHLDSPKGRGSLTRLSKPSNPAAGEREKEQPNPADAFHFAPDFLASAHGAQDSRAESGEVLGERVQQQSHPDASRPPVNGGAARLTYDASGVVGNDGERGHIGRRPSIGARYTSDPSNEFSSSAYGQADAGTRQHQTTSGTSQSNAGIATSSALYPWVLPSEGQHNPSRHL